MKKTTITVAWLMREFSLLKKSVLLDFPGSLFLMIVPNTKRERILLNQNLTDNPMIFTKGRGKNSTFFT